MNYVSVVACGAPGSFVRRVQEDPSIAVDLRRALVAMVDMFERHIDGRPGPDDAAKRWDDTRAALVRCEV